jgi:hypothetical protein
VNAAANASILNMIFGYYCISGKNKEEKKKLYKEKC